MKPGGRLSILASLGVFCDSAWSAARRFPVVLILCVASAAYAVWMVGLAGEPQELHHVLSSLALGLPLSLGLAMASERYGGLLRRHALPLNLALLLGLALHYILMERIHGEGYHIRYAHQLVAVGTAFFVAPFLGRNEGNGFRQFSRLFLTRAFVSGLYSAVFFAAFALAVLSVEKLFDVSVEERTYLRLWLLTVFVVFPWHLMAGLPAMGGALARDSAWPGYIRVFAQYLLVPIVIAYALILYAYMGRIVWLRDWPRGTVAWLVTGISIVGTATWLIAGAFRGNGKARLLGAFHRAFFWLVPPLLILHILGLWRRTSEYGLTEPRYFLFGLGLWMLAMAGYFLFSRARDIRAIPVTLVAVSILALWGPWSAYEVAVRDQAGRLSALFATNGLVREGKLIPARGKIDWEQRREISSKLDYLVSRGRLGALGSLLTPGLRALAEEADSGDNGWRRLRGDRTRKFMDRLGMEYVREWEKRSAEARFGYYAQSQPAESVPFPVAGYEYAQRLGSSFRSSFSLGGKPCQTRLSGSRDSVEFLVAGDVVARVPLEKAARKARAEEGMRRSRGPVPALTIEFANERARLLLYIVTITGYAGKEKVSVDSGTGILFIRLR
jgi:hypothetical protein